MSQSEKSTCVFSTDTSGVQSCGLGLAEPGEMPGACASCSRYSGPARGLGDRIKDLTDKVGIKPCGGCQRRREKLNKASGIIQQTLAEYKKKRAKK